MNARNLKWALSIGFGVAMMGVSSSGLAQVSPWTAGDCQGNHTNPGPAPCFDSDGYHFNGSGGAAGQWVGDINGNDFVFSGDTVLTCGSTVLDCTLTLDGQVKKFEDGGNWFVGIKVTGGSVTGGGFCGLVGVGGFPWYAADTSTIGGFGETTGIPYPGPLAGNIGGGPGTNGIAVTLFGAPLVQNSHVQNVTYDNATSTFNFNSTLYENGTGDPTDCSVVGGLSVQSPVNYIHIH